MGVLQIGYQKPQGTLYFLLLLLALSGAPFAVCGNLVANYTLTGSETNSGTCFTLSAENITLDCNGYTINVTGGTAVPSVDVNARGTTIRNCNIVDTSATNVAMGAVRLTANGNNATIINTTIKTIGHYALYVLSSNNTFMESTFNTTTQNQYGIYLTSSSNNTFRNVVVNKTATAGTYAIYYFNGDGNVFDNVTIESQAGAIARYGAYLYGVTNSNISNSNFYARDYPAIWLLGGATGNTINNTNISSITTASAHGIQLSAASDSAPYNNIYNSRINVSGVGIYIMSSAGYTRMENLTIITNMSSGIYIASTAGTSDYNYINNVNVTALNYPLSYYQGSSYNSINNSILNSTANTAFYAYGATSYNNFTNCRISSRMSGGTAYAMYFTASSSTYNIIHNSTIWSPTYYSVYFAGTSSSNNVIEGNNITAAAGAAGYGVTFASSSSNYNNVTNNNITAIYAGAYGVYMYGDYNNVIGNNVSAGSIGIYLVYSTYATVRNNYIDTNATGVNAIVYLTSSDYNTVANNNLTHRGASGSNYGVLLSTSSSNMVENNSINTTGNNAIHVTSTSNYNNFTNNSVYTNATNYYGLQVTTNCNYNRFIDNNITSYNGYGAALLAVSRYNLVSGGRIFGRTQAAFTINNANNNNVTNTTLTSGDGGIGGSYGLYMTVTSGNRISRVNISTNNSYGVYLTGGVGTSEFDQVTAVSNLSYSFYASSDVTSNAMRNFNFTSVRSGPAVYTAGNPTPVTGNNFTNGTIDANVSSSYALYVYYGSNSNNFNNVTIRNIGATGGTAVYFAQASIGNTISNSYINASNAANSYGVLAQTGSTGNYISNSTIYAPFPGTGYDVYVGNLPLQPSSIVLLNTTFDPFSTYFGDANSYLNVSWYLRANVSDLAGTTPIENANVTLIDALGNAISSSMTDQNGLSSWAVAKQYRQVQGSSTNYYPYQINVTAGSVFKNQSQATLPESTTASVLLNASICGAISSDYNLTNSVYSNSSCFSATASGITLNCNGYSINYSRSAPGCGFSANLQNGLVLKNCNFAQGAYGSNGSSAICLTTNSNATVANSTITARGGGNGYDFNLSNSEAHALNTSINASNSVFSGVSSLYRRWYVNVNLTDLSGSPLVASRLLIADSANSTAANTSVNDGVAPAQALAEYRQNGSGFVYYSNFTVNGSAGSVSNQTVVNLTSNTNIAMALNVTTCGAANSSVTLKNDLYSNGTCFAASAGSIAIDCAGYAINYSRASSEAYALDTAGHPNVTLRNCTITLGNASSALSYAVYVNGSTGFVVANSTVNGRLMILNRSSIDAEVVNTQFIESTMQFNDSESNASVEWYARVHTRGLANESVPESPVSAVDVLGNPSANGTADANGNITFLLKEYSQRQSGTTIYTPYNFSAVHPVTQTVNYTVSEINETKTVEIGLISAAINFTTPSRGQIYFQGDSVPITVNVTLGQTWVTNVTLNVSGDTRDLEYQATEIAPYLWQYNYSVDPSQPSTVLNITAKGYNGSVYVNASNYFVVTRSNGSGVDPPIITYYCPKYTYLVQNQTTNVSVTAVLDTVLYAMTLTVTYPNGSTATPAANSSSYNLTTLTYNYTWTLNATQVGNYSLFIEVRDVNDNRVNETRQLYAAASNATVNLTATGITSLHLRDVCSGTTVASGASLSNVSVPPGNYTLVAVDTNKTNVSFNNFNVSTFSGNFLTYSEESASGLPVPANRRNIMLFSGYVGGGTFTSAGILVDYSDVAGTLVAENSLEMDQCDSRLSCSWALLNSTLNTTLNRINSTVANISGLYGLFEPAYTTPQIIPINASLPNVTLSPSMANSLVGSNITVYLSAALITNLSAVSMNVTYPSGGTAALSNISYANGSNYTYNFTYSFVINETGTYTLTSFVNDAYYQNTTTVAFVNAAAANVSVAISSIGVNSSALDDPGRGVRVLAGTANISGSITPGNYTYYANASNASFTYRNFTADGSVQSLNYTDLEYTAVIAPNRTGIYLFAAGGSNASYSLANATINYTGQLSRIVSEVALEVWTCPSLASCGSLTRLNATINTDANTITFNSTNLSGVYGLYHPAQVTTIPIAANAPDITLFTTSRKNAVQGTNVTVYLNLQLGANLSTVEVNASSPSGINATLLNNSYANGTNYTYNLTYSLISTEAGNYTLTAFVSDAYGQNLTENATFLSAATSGMVITSYNFDSTRLIDTGVGTAVLTGASVLVGSQPLGLYTYEANSSNVSVLLYNFSASGISTALNYSNLTATAVTAPANRSAVRLFYASNVSAAYGSAQVALNYSGQAASVISEVALEVWTCQSVSNCTNMTRVNATIDAALHTVSFNLTNVSGVYGLYQPLQTVVTPISVAQPTVTYFTTSRANILRNSNVTVYLNLQLGANLTTVTLNATRPSGSSVLLNNTSYSSVDNYTYNYTYVINATEAGEYTLAAYVQDAYGQNNTTAITFSATAFNSGIIITSYGLNSSQLIDPGINTVVLTGGSVLSGSIPLGIYTYSATGENATFTFRGAQVYGNVQGLNYTPLASGSLPSLSNRTLLYAFEGRNLGIEFTSGNATINYTGQLSSIISEAALEVWTCNGVSDCASMTRVNATIDTTLHTATFNFTNVSGAYALYHPAQVTVVPVVTSLPGITYFATSRKIAAQNSNVTVYLNLQLGTNLTNATLNATAPSESYSLVPNASYSNGTNYTYNFTYALNATEAGNYTLIAFVTDAYGQNATSNITFTSAPAGSMTITSYNFDTTRLIDTGIGATVLSGGSVISGSEPAGIYTYEANSSNVSMTLYNFSASALATTLNYSNLSASAVPAPANRTAVRLFYANNVGATFGSAQALLNYSGQTAGVVSEAALEVWTCPSVSNCSVMTRVNATIDTALHTAAFNLSSISGVYGLYQPLQTVTITTTQPTITYYTTSRKNAKLDTNVTVYLNLQLWTNLTSVALNATAPSGSSSLLQNSTYTNGSSYNYNLTYVINASEEGTYSLSAYVADAYAQNTTQTITFTAGNESAVAIASIGVNQSGLVDTGTMEVLLSGNDTLSGSVPFGNYTYHANATNASFRFSNLSVNGNMTVLNYSDLAPTAVSAPANRSALMLFSAYALNDSFSGVNATFNYTGVLSSIVTEAALEVWTCPLLANCSFMAKVNSTIDTSARTVSFSLSNVSGVYGLYQAQSTTTTVVHNATPAITLFAPGMANLDVGSGTVVYLNADLDATLSSVAVNATSPNGSTYPLAQLTNSSGAGFAYNFTFNFTALENGTYSLAAFVNDSYGQNATAAASMYVAAANTTALIMSNGIDSSLLADSGMNASVLLGNESLSGNITPGNYTYYANASNVSFAFFNLSVGGSAMVLDFGNVTGTNLSSPPPNRTALFLFNASSPDANYSSVRFTINYSDLLQGIVSEAALEVWTCHEISDCNMTALNATIDTAGHTATVALSNLSSVYGLYQPSSVQTNTVTVTVTQYSSSTSYVNKNVMVEKNVTVEVPGKEVIVEVPEITYVSSRLLSTPELFELHPGESATKQVRVENGVGDGIGAIGISVIADAGVTASLSAIAFELKKGESGQTLLTVNAGNSPGNYRVRVTAVTSNSQIKDEAVIPVIVSLDTNEDRLAAQKKIDFADSLIKSNPECLELRESLATAALYLDNGKFAQADGAAQNTIAGCSGIMALRGKPIVQTETVPEMDFTLSVIAPIVVAGLAVGIGLILFMIIKRVKRRHVS